MLGDILIEKNNIISPLSAYQPSDSIRELTFAIKQKYQDGETNLTTSYKEFNNRSVICKFWCKVNIGNLLKHQKSKKCISLMDTNIYFN